MKNLKPCILKDLGCIMIKYSILTLYLDEWSQLEDFGVEMLVVYNNLNSLSKLAVTHPDYKKVAIGIRIIDINTGDILQVGELTNIN